MTLLTRFNRKNLGIDPTRTKVLRDRFSGEMFKRFNRLKGDILKSLVRNDALGLVTNQPLSPGQFAFRTLDEKHLLFMEWIREQVDSGILEVTQRVGTSTSIRNPWMDLFLQSAYQKGILRARQELRSAGKSIPSFEGETVGAPSGIGAAFNQPVHAERAALIFTRAFEELKGITAAMDQSISRVLAQGMIEGQSPRVVARLLNREVDKIGIVRARRLARTETVRAHHAANIAEYRLAEIEGIEIVAEFITAGDSKVCRRCANLAGRRFTLDEAEGLIPVHPNCRCAAIPIVEDDIRDQKPFQSPEQIKKVAGLK